MEGLYVGAWSGRVYFSYSCQCLMYLLPNLLPRSIISHSLHCFSLQSLWNARSRSSTMGGGFISRCENRSQCNITASNQLFGDPCTPTFKYLEVEYTCAPIGGKVPPSMGCRSTSDSISRLQLPSMILRGGLKKCVRLSQHYPLTCYTFK